MEHTQNQACEEWVPHLAACALGEEPDAELRAHLAVCPRCAAELRSFGRVARVLPHSAPAIAPPPRLRETILAAAGGQAVARRQPAPRTTWRWGWAAAALALVSLLLLGWNVWLLGQLRRSEADVARLQTTLATTRSELSAAQAELAQAVERLATTSAQIERSRTNWGSITVLFNSPDLQAASLAGDGALARVWFTPSSDEGCFVARGLPAPGEGRVYQVWLKQGDTHISGGTFTPVGDNAWIVLRPERPIASFSSIDVTLEPEGGSPAPTSAPVLQGSLGGSASLGAPGADL